MGKKLHIELLAPARDLKCGRGAIDHGADAVYIGAPRFGARSAAGNSLKDIAALISYAHRFWARVYITLNTVLFDNELDDARALIVQLYEAGADALIFQDMGLLELDLPPIPLFASTQTHNYALERIQFLERVGIRRVILARELSLQQIAEIRAATTLELEAFVHGALCVSFSGQCYFSEAVKGRSANRGECAQMCRLPYTVTDARGNVLASNKHVLSLKDLNLSQHIPALIDAGVTSFKIEGRLKDVTYVKNITAFYRRLIDDLFAERPLLHAASSGTSQVRFTPDPASSFNRGFTSYFIKRRSRDMVSMRTPKAIGTAAGTVSSVSRASCTITPYGQIHNGDGVCFFDDNDELRGVQINRVEGNRIHPDSMAGITPGTILYRNRDHHFAKLLHGASAVRTIAVSFVFDEQTGGFILRATDEDGTQAESTVLHPKVQADKPEAALQTFTSQLSRTGQTEFVMKEFTYAPAIVYFVPAAILNALRRACLTSLAAGRARRFPRLEHARVLNAAPYPATTLDKYANVVNSRARDFYRRHGVQHIDPGVEMQESFAGTHLMTTKYCLKYQFELCQGDRGSAEPLFLSDGRRRYKLEFNCDRCMMKIVAPQDTSPRRKKPRKG